jgi:hypothetical protein
MVFQAIEKWYDCQNPIANKKPEKKNLLRRLLAEHVRGRKMNLQT